MAVDRIFLYTTSSGSCFTQSQVMVEGYPRLYDPSDIYVYRCAAKLLVSRDGGFTWTNILPSDIGSANVVAQTPGEGSTTVTYVIGRGNGAYVARYQNVPEGATWSSGSAPPAGLVAVDAAADNAGDIGILIGNSGGTGPRIVASTTGAPFSLATSDSGIPQVGGNFALMTDIEICE